MSISIASTVLSETQGHHAREQILIQAARRLSGTVRETDTVARVGRDEFVIIQALTEQPADTAALAGSDRDRNGIAVLGRRSADRRDRERGRRGVSG